MENKENKMHFLIALRVFFSLGCVTGTSQSHTRARTHTHTQTRANISKCQSDDAVTNDDDDDDEDHDVEVKVCFRFHGRAVGVDLRNPDPDPGPRHNDFREVSKFSTRSSATTAVRCLLDVTSQKSLVQNTHTLTSSQKPEPKSLNPVI